MIKHTNKTFSNISLFYSSELKHGERYISDYVDKQIFIFCEMAAVNTRRILSILLLDYRRSRGQRHHQLMRIPVAMSLLQKRRAAILKTRIDIYRSILKVKSKYSRLRNRSCRRLLRNTGWWAKVRDIYNDERFAVTLRVSRPTFYFVLSKIQHRLEKKTVIEIPVPPDMRLDLTLYKLSLYTIAEMCGLATSTVCRIIIDTCEAITEVLWDETVSKHFPSSKNDFSQSLQEFGEEWQFPYAFAAIDGSHLPIRCPNGGAHSMKQYFNFKGFYSIILMALVDAKYRFIWASVGAPGNTHDSTYFQSTELWRKIQRGNIIPNITPSIDDIEIPPVILGDGAFPLRTWLLKPHGDAVLPEDKRYFNYRHSRARLVTEGAFGRLKSRFRVLYKKCESNKDTVKLYGLASVILHNICIERGDLVPRAFDLTVENGSNKRRSPEEVREILCLTNTNQRNFDITGRAAATKVRDAITKNIWSEKQDIF